MKRAFIECFSMPAGTALHISHESSHSIPRINGIRWGLIYSHCSRWEKRGLERLSSCSSVSGLLLQAWCLTPEPVVLTTVVYCASYGGSFPEPPKKSWPPSVCFSSFHVTFFHDAYLSLLLLTIVSMEPGTLPSWWLSCFAYMLSPSWW